MWANAQRDGRPVEYRWHPLFNAAKFGWRPLLECRAVMLPRCETRWNLQGCPKLANRSQPLVGLSSPYYQDMWRRYWCLTSFFPIVDTCLSSEDIARQSCAMVPKWRFLRPVFSASWRHLYSAAGRPSRWALARILVPIEIGRVRRVGVASRKPEVEISRRWWRLRVSLLRWNNRWGATPLPRRRREPDQWSSGDNRRSSWIFRASLF